MGCYILLFSSVLELNEDIKGLCSKKVGKKILISKTEYAGLICCGTENGALLSAIHQLVSSQDKGESWWCSGSSAEQQCWNWASPKFTCWGFGVWNRSSATLWRNDCMCQGAGAAPGNEVVGSLTAFRGTSGEKDTGLKVVLVHGALPFEMEVSCRVPALC